MPETDLEYPSDVAALFTAHARKGDFCNWKEDEIDGAWESDCGDKWIFSNNGTPEENHMRFCCFCGRPLMVR